MAPRLASGSVECVLRGTGAPEHKYVGLRGVLKAQSLKIRNVGLFSIFFYFLFFLLFFFLWVSVCKKALPGAQGGGGG